MKTFEEHMEIGMKETKQSMQRAIALIDVEFGTGYAERHPKLVGSVMKVAFGAATISMTSPLWQPTTEPAT